MKKRMVIYADENKILTNGRIYGKEIFLTSDDCAENFYEIDEQEFLQKQKIAQEAIEEALS